MAVEITCPACDSDAVEIQIDLGHILTRTPNGWAPVLVESTGATPVLNCRTCNVTSEPTDNWLGDAGLDSATCEAIWDVIDAHLIAPSRPLDVVSVPSGADGAEPVK